MFQSTLPRGERLTGMLTAPSPVSFNPRSHEGSDLSLRISALTAFVFQSTLPRGERQNIAVRPRGFHRFQSTLPRGERRRFPHAVLLRHSFNPRSHEGSDGSTERFYCRWIKFQSTLPRGERLDFCSGWCSGKIVSIHAPTRGATSGQPCSDTCHSCFNPRSHEGSDHISERSVLRLQKFQSTLPRGERRVSLNWCCSVLGFQSTLPRGERLCVPIHVSSVI